MGKHKKLKCLNVYKVQNRKKLNYTYKYNYEFISINKTNDNNSTKDGKKRKHIIRFIHSM